MVCDFPSPNPLTLERAFATPSTGEDRWGAIQKTRGQFIDRPHLNLTPLVEGVGKANAVLTQALLPSFLREGERDGNGGLSGANRSCRAGATSPSVRPPLLKGRSKPATRGEKNSASRRPAAKASRLVQV
jgi:hypothetical protein